MNCEIINSDDFLQQLEKFDSKYKNLNFSKYGISNEKIKKLIVKENYIILPYVFLEKENSVQNMLKDMYWCSKSLQDNFVIKYILLSKPPDSDQFFIIFENLEDKIFFLLRYENWRCY